jgi:2-polyprenyl-6-methoxyphenol hydroxylase-like FAD-dependent oxidoreductase
LRSWRGTILSQIDLRELGRLLGDLTVVLRRAELLSVLRDAAFGAEIRLGARCVGFEQNERRAKAFLADGSSVEGDLLIGADGLHSVIRAQLFGPREPRYSGYVAWRAITEFEHGRLTPGISLGRGSQFGQVPLKEINRVYWFATRNLSHRMHGTSENPKPDLLAVFAQWHKPVAELIEATEERAIFERNFTTGRR